MIIAESYKILGILSILIVWIGNAFLIYRWPGKPSMSLSHHAAQTKVASLYYASFLIPAVTMFYLFMNKWFVPSFDLKQSIMYILVLGVLGQYVACLVPDTKGIPSKIHQMGAYVMSTSLPIVIGYMVFAPTIPSFIRLLDLIILVIMLSIYGLFLFTAKAKERFLAYQCAYVMLFHVSILITTYVS